MLRGHKGSWILAAAVVGALASLAPACGSSTEGGPDRVCAPNVAQSCPCPGDTAGVQTCSADGTSFSVCDCSGGGTGGAGGGSGNAVCGNNMKEGNEACDDGNMVAGDGCEPNCTETPTCGNLMPDPGECGPEGTCPNDCLCGNMMADPGECGAVGTCPQDCPDPCLDALIFAGLTTQGPSGPIWDYGGLTGIDAGNAMCKQIGADHICTHAEMKKAEQHVVAGKNELAGLPAGTNIWSHRENLDVVGGVMGGAGARCNEWKYETNHISDGEWCEFDGTGVMTCHYDSDPVFDQLAPKVQADLPCGGAMRNIACCFEACVTPP